MGRLPGRNPLAVTYWLLPRLYVDAMTDLDGFPGRLALAVQLKKGLADVEKLGSDATRIQRVFA